MLAAEPSFEVQATLMIAHGIIWGRFTKALAKRLGPWLLRQTWQKRFRERTAEMFKRSYDVEFPHADDLFEFTCLLPAILWVHFAGGLLCVPSLVWGSSAATVAMAAQGNLCEAGWELSEVAKRAAAILGLEGRRGREKNPFGLVFWMGLHHLVSLTMIVPMNASKHRENRDYHELSFLLQFAAFVCGFAQLWGFTLDLSTATGLARMRGAVLVASIVAWYSRAFRFAVVATRLLAAVRDAGDERMFYGGVVGLGAMAVFNAALVKDMSKRFYKFWSGSFLLPTPRQWNVGPARSSPAATELHAQRLTHHDLLDEPAAARLGNDDGTLSKED